MKNIRFALLFISLAISLNLLISNANAQASQYSDLRRPIFAADTLDMAKLHISYALTYMPDPKDTNNLKKDFKILQIGDKITKFYSYYVFQSDSLITADYKNGRLSAPIRRTPDILGEGYEIYNNYPEKGKRVVIDAITSITVYKYEEESAMPQWTIIGETTEIMGYQCIKATGSLGGRDYEAWFTLSIPISAGPWKLGGLPGLILRAYDSNRHYVFECSGIERLKQQPIIMPGVPAIIPGLKYAANTKKEYMKDQKRYHNDYINYLLGLGINIVLLDDDGNITEQLNTPNETFRNMKISRGMKIYARDRYKKVPYNPIEIE